MLPAFVVVRGPEQHKDRGGRYTTTVPWTITGFGMVTLIATRGQDWLTMAANGGHLECLKYAHENGCPWDIFTCADAAHGGHMQCLKYAHEQGCPWDADTCSMATLGGHLECLKYAQENGCPGLMADT